MKNNKLNNVFIIFLFYCAPKCLIKKIGFHKQRFLWFKKYENYFFSEHFLQFFKSFVGLTNSLKLLILINKIMQQRSDLRILFNKVLVKVCEFYKKKYLSNVN